MVKVPYKLGFGVNGKLIPGRGEAGWTVGEFPTREEAESFMTRYAAAEMACWPRILRDLAEGA